MHRCGQTKPDGAPGWQSFFLKAGHNVYVSDAVERGRASWARYPEIYKSEPMFRSKRETWELFRIGATGSYHRDPAKRVANPGQQFPATAFDQFTMQCVSRWLDNDVATEVAYDALIAKVGPCVILCHSQCGNFGLRSALRNSHLVRAVVAVEPSGAPATGDPGLARLKSMPQLFLITPTSPLATPAERADQQSERGEPGPPPLLLKTPGLRGRAASPGDAIH